MKGQEVRRAIDLEMTEKDLQRAVVQLAEVYGYRRSYHTYDSRRSAKGFPDLVLVGRGRVIFAELKSERGKVSPEQQGWLEDLGEIGGNVHAYLWRPSDLEQIPEALK